MLINFTYLQLNIYIYSILIVIVDNIIIYIYIVCGSTPKDHKNPTHF